ncbi:3-deoxy-manno-octulosonate cytidylyltransferase [Hoeflea sp.]|uniref:3-deoxy-manno-octulosonate cytidylyltransferase n=1 Tax=Hoeflea sp. TaxID=1940281 RepID=UPI003B011DE5
MASQSNLVLIPARMGSSRLPGKVLADIAGEPMIVHVARRGREADIGPVVVATDSPEVEAAVSAAGFDAVMTRSDHASGSDRIFEALQAVDVEGKYDVIVNIQGDLPTIETQVIRSSLTALENPQTDIGTLAVTITSEEEKTNPNVTKAVGSPIGDNLLRALYFTRATAPYGDGPLYHHIGLYAYRRDALSRFVSLPPSTLEKREKLEQLRALEAGMRIDIAVVDSVPLGVDTPADLERARLLLSD